MPPAAPSANMDHRKVLRILEDIDTASNNEMRGALLIIQGMAEKAKKVEAESAAAPSLATNEATDKQPATKVSQPTVTILKNESKDDAKQEAKRYEVPTVAGQSIESFQATVIIVKSEDKLAITVSGDIDAKPEETAKEAAPPPPAPANEEDWSWYKPSKKTKKGKKHAADLYLDEEREPVPVPEPEPAKTESNDFSTKNKTANPVEDDIWAAAWAKSSKKKTKGEIVEEPEQLAPPPPPEPHVEDCWGFSKSSIKKKKKAKGEIVGEADELPLPPAPEPPIEDDWGFAKSSTKKKKKKTKGEIVEELYELAPPPPVEVDWEFAKSSTKKKKKTTFVEPKEVVPEPVPQPVEEADDWDFSKSSTKEEKKKKISSWSEEVTAALEPSQTDLNCAMKPVGEDDVRQSFAAKSKKPKEKKSVIAEEIPPLLPDFDEAEKNVEAVPEPPVEDDWGSWPTTSKKKRGGKKTSFVDDVPEVCEPHTAAETNEANKPLQMTEPDPDATTQAPADDFWGFTTKKKTSTEEEDKIESNAEYKTKTTSTDDIWASIPDKRTKKGKKDVMEDEATPVTKSKSPEDDPWGDWGNWGVSQSKKDKKSKKGTKSGETGEAFNWSDFDDRKVTADGVLHEDEWSPGWGFCAKKEKKAKKKGNEEDTKDQIADLAEKTEEARPGLGEDFEAKNDEKTEDKAPNDDKNTHTEKPPKIENMTALTSLLPDMMWFGVSSSWYPKNNFETQEQNITMMGEMHSMFKRMYSGQRVARSILGVVLTNCLYLHNKEHPNGQLKPPYKRSYIKVERISTGKTGDCFTLDSADTILNHVVCDFTPSHKDWPNRYSTFVCCTPRSDCTDQQLIAHCAANTVGLQQKTQADTGHLFATYGCCCLSSSEWIFFCFDVDGTLYRSNGMQTAAAMDEIVQLLRGILCAVSNTRKAFNLDDNYDEPQGEEKTAADEGNEEVMNLSQKGEETVEVFESTKQPGNSPAEDLPEQAANFAEEQPEEPIPAEESMPAEEIEPAEEAMPTEEIMPAEETLAEETLAEETLAEETLAEETLAEDIAPAKEPVEALDGKIEEACDEIKEDVLPPSEEEAVPTESAIPVEEDKKPAEEEMLLAKEEALDNSVEAQNEEPKLEESSDEQPLKEPVPPPRLSEEQIAQFKWWIERKGGLEKLLAEEARGKPHLCEELTDEAMEKVLDSPPTVESPLELSFEDEDKVSVGEDGVIAFED